MKQISAILRRRLLDLPILKKRRDAEHSRVSKILAEHSFENSDIGAINNVAQAAVFVISMPKCATSSIHWGLERLGFNVIHAHNDLTTYNAFPNGAILKDNSVTLESLITFRQHQNTTPAFFFCGYREPISWYLSLAGQFSVPLNGALAENIAENITSAHPWKNYSFYDAENIIERSIGIRLRDNPFDRKLGYKVLARKNSTAVLYRFDKMASVGHFIATNIDKRFEMLQDRHNTCSEYSEFVKNFRIPVRTLLSLYSTKAHRYFYGRHETEKLIERFGT